MEPSVGAFEKELERRRERYNTAFAMARRARPRLDGEVFLENLRTLVAPIINALPPSQAGPVVEPLYDLCLELTGSDLFRRSHSVQHVWRHLLPKATAELLQEPRLLPAALSNAAYNMEREESTHVDLWLEKMEECRADCGGAQRWLQVGQVNSWRYGMAHFRETAIAVGNSLPTELRRSLYPDWDNEVSDPWHAFRELSNAPFIARRVGSFLGFGGVFRQPPWVAYAGDGRFLVEDGTASWILSSDAFGAILKPGHAEVSDSSRSDVDVKISGTVTWGAHELEYPELAGVRSFASSDNLLAVTTDLSHHVILILGPKA